MNRKNKFFVLIGTFIIIGILSGVIISINYIFDNQNTDSQNVDNQNIQIMAELNTLDKAFGGHPHYYVGSLCIEDISSNTAFLNYYGLSKAPVHPNYTTGQTSLTTNNCYLYFSDGENYSIRTPAVGNKGYFIQESRTQETKPIQKTCDAGWIPFGNRCVMKYEAKCEGTATCVVETSIVTSKATETPWANITQTDAKKECQKIGAHLITNAEWMAIARDIEAVSSNWTGMVLNRGHTDNAPANALAASTDSDHYYGTGQTIGEQKRTHTLSNGQVIWDFAGNVWEWVDDKIECQSLNCLDTLMPRPTGWQDYYLGVSTWGKYSRAELGVLGSFTGEINSVGKIYNDLNYAYVSGSGEVSPIHSFLRGGGWYNAANVGVFALGLSNSLLDSNSNLGFRCVK